MSDYDVAIIGGGACGLMCAVQAGFLGKKAIVLEKNKLVGAKILISGGGRCNYTNLHSSASNFISGNNHFCKSVLAQWSVADTISFFETYGIQGQEKTLGQLFPLFKKAKDVVKVFEKLCTELTQTLLCNTEVKSVYSINGDFHIKYTFNHIEKTLIVPKVVVASGGLAIPKMGATDFGLKIAKEFGMEIIKPAPALVPLTITGKDTDWYTQLTGTNIFCRVSNDSISFEENILFTHWGLSGPAILQISSYWEPGQFIEIDFLPHQNIQEIIRTEKLLNGKKLLYNLLASLYTKKFAEALHKFLPINKNIASLNKDDIRNINEIVHHLKIKPAGNKGYDKAEVMRGGVATSALSSKTLESKKVSGLYFGGECIDVTGWLGGYNFQWAWASGYVIAKQI